MLKFVICDDNSIILNQLSKMLEAIFINNNYEATIVYKGTNVEQILNYIRTNSVDVLILDINFKSNVTGLDIAKTLREFNKNAYIIFSTGHLEYAMLAYKVKTFDYLPKPITLERLEESINRLFNDMHSNPSKYIHIGSKKTLINQDDIFYIQRDGMKIVFKTSSGSYESYTSFNKLQSQLPKNFVRCHKSYIANINKIINIQNNSTISFSNNMTCSIGPKYINNLLEVLI